MNVSSKNTLGALIIAASLFLFWAFIVTTYQQIPQYKQEIEKREKILAERQEILDKIDKMYAEYQQKKNSIQVLSFAVPTKRDIENIITSIDAIATQSGIRLSEISVSEDKKSAAGALANVSLKLSMEGTYQGFLSFLSSLEQNTRIIDVFSAALSLKEGSILSLELKANAYLVK